MTRDAAEQSRALSNSERSVIDKILDGSGLPEAGILKNQLEAARVSRSTYWMMDIEVSRDAKPAPSIPNGPLAVQALVPNEKDYRGELLVWVEGGVVTGLEYAYVTEEVPEDLPALDEIQVQCG